MANTTGKKYGGRKKGTPNKTTMEIREMFQSLVANNLERLQNDLDELHARQRVEAIINIAKFVLPQLKATDIHVDKEKEINSFVIDMSKWK